MNAMIRIRSAIRALFARNPRIAIEVIDGTWHCQWHDMTAENAAEMMRRVSDEVSVRLFAQMPCEARVH